MSLKKRQLDASLTEGYTSEGLQKDGARCTFAATFGNVGPNMKARLEQSIDGENYQEVPGSETTLDTGDAVQMWNDDMLPRGVMLRIVVDSGPGSILTIKLLSNG